MPLELANYYDEEDVSLRSKPVETKFGLLHTRFYTVATAAFDALKPAQGAVMPGIETPNDLSARVQTISRKPKTDSAKCLMVVTFHELQAVSSRV